MSDVTLADPINRVFRNASLEEFMKALLDLFKQVTQEEEFDAIKIGVPRRRKSAPGRSAK